MIRPRGKPLGVALITALIAAIFVMFAFGLAATAQRRGPAAGGGRAGVSRAPMTRPNVGGFRGQTFGRSPGMYRGQTLGRTPYGQTFGRSPGTYRGPTYGAGPRPFGQNMPRYTRGVPYRTTPGTAPRYAMPTRPYTQTPGVRSIAPPRQPGRMGAITGVPPARGTGPMRAAPGVRPPAPGVRPPAPGVRPTAPGAPAPGTRPPAPGVRRPPTGYPVGHGPTGHGYARYYPPSHREGHYYYHGRTSPYYYGFWGFGIGLALGSGLYYSPFFYYGFPYVYAPRVEVVEVPQYTYVPVPYYYYGNNYYLSQGYQTGLNAAIDDIRNAWLTGNGSLLLQHVQPAAQIAVYLNGAYSYSLSGTDYSNMVRDAIGHTRTVSFVITGVQQRSDGAYEIQATHTLYNADNQLETVNVTYTLAMQNGRWVIVAVGSST